MTRKTARLNSFNGEARVTAKVGETRALIEKYLEDNSGDYSTDHIATATGLSVYATRKKLAEMAAAGVVISTVPGSRRTTYKHISHWKREQLVTRREPITNAFMPNGSTSYWAKHMTALNTPPRAA